MTQERPIEELFNEFLDAMKIFCGEKCRNFKAEALSVPCTTEGPGCLFSPMKRLMFEPKNRAWVMENMRKMERQR